MRLVRRSKRRVASTSKRKVKPKKQPLPTRSIAVKTTSNPYLSLQSSTPLPSISVILSAQNEEDSIGAVLSEVSRLPIQEIIIVLNGCTDGTYGIARTYPLAKIIHYPDPIGHDVGRAIGAKMASSDILLFVDADIPITAQDLMPFVQAIHQGVDVALNDINPYLSTFDRRDDLSRCKEFLNRSLGRRDLTVNSLTAIPHALSRKAMETIGYTYLMVPPKAQAIAILKGLRVEVCTSVNVVERNKIRKTNVGQTNPVAELIIGDHLEAIREAMDICGSRLALTDNQRNHIAARRNRR
ncbi:glycosyltransferase family 2 protein [Paenibacillus selenitireducens]|uniref:glycosyltransferase family 2 protein n=1 Tax=Paenibacillus selenitireducens TaxID=1324314 RepID=UPI001E5133F4|nr:glycosyltransferase [Paenibacillus selenitireducens]